MRVKLMVTLVVVGVLLSCQIQPPVKNDQSPELTSGSPENIQTLHSKAADEFLKDFPSYLDKIEKDPETYLIAGTGYNQEYLTINPEAFGKREEILSKAYEAYMTGDTPGFKNYLVEQGLYEGYCAILKKYDLAQPGTLETKSQTKSKPSDETKKYRRELMERAALTGDVVVVRGDSPLDWILTPFTYYTHSGIVDKTNTWRNNDEYCVLSISLNTQESGSIVEPKLGYESIDNYSDNASEFKLLRVKGREDVNARKALLYGQQFIGNPNYNFFTSREADDAWYCSKLAYRCWDDQGIDLDSPSIFEINWFGLKMKFRDAHVTPDDLFYDNDTYEITALPHYPKPVAVAGPDQPSLIDMDSDGVHAVELDGSNSYAPEGTIVEYLWNWEDENFYGERVSLELPLGTHEIRLTVTDDNGQQASDDILITVIEIAPDVMLPVAEAGEAIQHVYDLNNNGEEPVFLNGSASYDKDGTIIEWLWNIEGTLYTGETLEITLPVGEYHITLTVTDDTGLKALDEIQLFVEYDTLVPVSLAAKYGPSGGTGGKAFDAPLEKKKSEKYRRLTRVRFRQGNYVDSMELTWVNEQGQTFTSGRIGGSGGTSTNTIEFADDEYIRGVRVDYGNWVDRMYIYTNKRTVKVGGDPLWYTPKTYNFGNRECHGFFGKKGSYIDSIGFYTYTKEDVGR